MEERTRVRANRKGRPGKASSQKHTDEYRARVNKIIAAKTPGSPGSLSKGRQAMDAKWLISPEDEAKLIEAIRSSRDCGDDASQTSQSGSDSTSFPTRSGDSSLPSFEIGHIPWGILMCLPPSVTNRISGYETKSPLNPVGTGAVRSDECTLVIDQDELVPSDTLLPQEDNLADVSIGVDVCQSDYCSDLIGVPFYPAIPEQGVVRNERVRHVHREVTPIQIFVGYDRNFYPDRSIQRCSHVGELSLFIDSVRSVFRCCGSYLSFCASVILWPLLYWKIEGSAIS